MSRREIPAYEANHKVFVGWDHPMQTYFGQVYRRDRKDRDDALIHWVGADRPGQIYDIEDLRRAMVLYADLSPDTCRELHADKDEGL
jgi:hypothetical protein